MARRDGGAAGVARRTVLGGVLATALGAVGCRPFVAAQQRSAPPDPDVVVTMRALAAEQALLDAYARMAERHASLAKRLAAFRGRHTAHRDALHARLPVGPSGRVVTPTPVRTATPSASRAASASPPAGDSLASLVAAERAAATDRVADALDASPTLAEVLASIGACEAAHVDLLAELNA